MSAVAGIILIGRISSASPIANESAEMNAIAACVLGGTSFTGGKGTVAGTLVGAMLMAIITNGLDHLSAQTDVKFMVIGAVIVSAVYFDVIRNKAEEKSRRLAQARAIEETAQM
jgi:ribose transport system permease protein